MFVEHTDRLFKYRHNTALVRLAKAKSCGCLTKT
jgi:hypothetical protein